MAFSDSFTHAGISINTTEKAGPMEVSIANQLPGFCSCSVTQDNLVSANSVIYTSIHTHIYTYIC